VAISPKTRRILAARVSDALRFVAVAVAVNDHVYDHDHVYVRGVVGLGLWTKKKRPVRGVLSSSSKEGQRLSR